MKKIIVPLIVALAAIGCHAQSSAVNLTWSAPAANGSWSGCSVSDPCVYAAFRCAAAASTCADISSSAWIEVTTADTRPSATSYSDTTAMGLIAYYFVETVQDGALSEPSNIAGPFAVGLTNPNPLLIGANSPQTQRRTSR